MKRAYLLLFVMALIVLSAGVSQALEFWNDLGVKQPIDEDWTFEIVNEVKVDYFSRGTQDYVDVSFAAQISKCFTLIGAIREVTYDDSKFSKTVTSSYYTLPHLDFKLSTNLGESVKFANTFRFIYDTSTNLLTWWDIINFAFPMKTGAVAIIPYIRPQFYWNFASMTTTPVRGIYELRADIGMEFKFDNFKWITPSIAYINDARNLDKSSNQAVTGSAYKTQGDASALLVALSATF